MADPQAVEQRRRRRSNPGDPRGAHRLRRCVVWREKRLDRVLHYGVSKKAEHWPLASGGYHGGIFGLSLVI